MTSFYKRAAIDSVQEKMKDRKWTNVLNEAVYKMNSGFWSEEYISAVVQKHWSKGNVFDLYDADSFLKIHTAIGQGRLLYCHVMTDCDPFKDKQIEANNGVLANLPSPFWGEFWGGTADCDGMVGWNKSITVDRIRQKDGDHKIKKVNPSVVPLEVGFTDGARTWLHVCWSRGIARWPYHSDKIWIFVSFYDWTELVWNGLLKEVEAHVQNFDDLHQLELFEDIL